MGERAKAGLLVLLFCAALVQGCLAANDEVGGGPGDGAVDESDLVRPIRRLHLLHAQRLGTVLHHLRPRKRQCLVQRAAHRRIARVGGLCL